MTDEQKAEQMEMLAKKAIYLAGKLYQTMNAKINHFNNAMGKDEAGYIAMITLSVFLKKMTKWMFKDMPMDMQKEFITDIAKEANIILEKEYKDGLQ